jgi:endonuclease YncB( thermonuclease family)
MNHSAGIFWGFIALLACASMFFGIGAFTQQKAISSRDGKIENGAIVHLVRVIDGDTVLVAEEGQKPAHVRLLGIKSFDAKIEKDAVSPYGKAAFEALERNLGNKPLRIMLQNGAKDRFGRYVATIYADDHDVALDMIEQGLVMAYTVYPFPALTVYLQAQDNAKKMKRGLWANSEASERATALINEWQREWQRQSR